MRTFSKGAAPAELEEYRRTSGATWNSVTGGTKKVLRSAHRREQSGVCVYCLRRLPKDTDAAPAIRIDHVRPRATHPELTFAWSNLVASCLGNTSRKDHCDPAKGERAIPLHPIETLGLEARFEYRGGKIKPAKTGDTDARDAIRLLNLNGNGLVSMRKSVLDELRRRLTPKGGGAFSRRALELQLARVKEDDSFAPMLRQRIKKKLQKKLR